MPSILMCGIEFEVGEPYKAGHKLSAAEAAALTQNLYDNYRNNWTRRIAQARAKCAEGLHEARPHTGLCDQCLASLRANFANYLTNYTFGGPRGRGAIDPVEVEAMKIARRQARASNTPEDSIEFEGLVAELSLSDEVLTEARRRVDEARVIAHGALDFDMSELLDEQ